METAVSNMKSLEIFIFASRRSSFSAFKILRVSSSKMQTRSSKPSLPKNESLPSKSKSRDMSSETPTQRHFQRLDQFAPLINAFKRRTRSADILKILPEDVQMIRRALPQFRELRGQEVMLVLGFCMKPDDEEECKTDKIVSALQMQGENPVLFLDLRNECRRKKDNSGCFSVMENEVEVLLASKALEIQIAQEEFGITIRAVLTFSGCWDHDRWSRILAALESLENSPPHYLHETQHLSRMQHTQLKYFAKTLSQTVMQDWSEKKILDSFKSVGVVETRLVPRVPKDFGARYRKLNEIAEESMEGLESGPEESEKDEKIVKKPRIENLLVENEGSDEDEIPEMKNRSRKSYASVACQSCRKGKEKCDGNTPCARCVRLDKECVPGEPRAKRGTKTSKG
ncbi:uncharacterized protein M437DRAFT_86579 [Aureobasidium melanogenum CBS 110374]|uniref:Zn(2)-C6 fungal-type domain-containing protein n=1 Tax=Aureobasidium melanogenum (strain CBS 110374) TaxID=1043003 RepID=A0A074WDB9_AURM1|nr:uncharacterized protein M437DRAFT_86579 [Aureobasidium melanogenum CBS 110374]KEQ60486.1 hypothetical protein M437DRAFT_86579 [Aureobasidium melanogenum CBS 110374]